MSRKKLLKNGWYRVNTIKKEDKITTNIEISDDDISFFRYRSCSDFSLGALIKDEFWVSKPTTFNDPYDTSLTYDSKRLHSKIAELKGQEISGISYDTFNDLHDYVNKSMKNNFYVACLSEKVDNPAMWSHYANYGSGFVVEYDFSQMEKLIKTYLELWFQDLIDYYGIRNNEINQIVYQRWFDLSGSFFPMFYTNKSKDFTDSMLMVLEKKGIDEIVNITNRDEFLQLFNYNLDDDIYINNMSMKNSLSTSKNSYWSYEKEWRLMVSSFAVEDHDSIGLVRPKAIYLGEFISEVNKILICKVAKSKSIDVYQMYSNHSLKGNKLRYRRVNEKELEEVSSLEGYDFTKYDEKL